MKPRVRMEVRRIASELDSFPYVARTFTPTQKGDGNAGHFDIVAGCGGAPVYHDVLREGGCGNRSFVRYVADRLIVGAPLPTKPMRRTAAAIEMVAELRVAGSRDISAPALPPDAGRYYQPASRLATPGKVGGSLAGYLRKHVRRPFGDRGVEWMIGQARLAWRAALRVEAV